MAAPKRTKLEREEQLPEIQRLHNRGYSTREIAAKLGLSHVAIIRDLTEIADRYRREANIERGVEVKQRIAGLREVRKEAWEAWEKSKENRERQVKEKISDSLDKNGNPTADTVQRMKAVITTEGQLPANEYLSTILRTFEEEAELLGLYAPKKIAPTTADGTDLCQPLTDAERAAALARLHAFVGAAGGSPAPVRPDAADGSLSGGPGAGTPGCGPDAGPVAGESLAGDVEPGAAPLFPPGG